MYIKTFGGCTIIAIKPFYGSIKRECFFILQYSPFITSYTRGIKSEAPHDFSLGKPKRGMVHCVKSLVLLNAKTS